MYFIKQISVDGDRYLSSRVLDFTDKKIAAARSLLEKHVRSYVRDEAGRSVADQSRIIDILNFSQVNEPMIDTVLLYRLADDPHVIYVYQRKTIVAERDGYLWGTWGSAPTSQFGRVMIFELEETHNLDLVSQKENGQDDHAEVVEMVPVGQTRIRIPKQMTISPMFDLIQELKKSERFKARLETNV